MVSPMFNPEEFVNRCIKEIRKLGIDCAIAAVSGGIDSTTAATIVYKVIGDRLKVFFLDTGFMRENEPEHVVNLLKNVLPSIQLTDVKQEFYNELIGEFDAEIKRRKFRSIFYRMLSRLAKDYGCTWLVQGTIALDWVETRDGIKTQHNVLEQIGIDTCKEFGFKVIEPLKELYKDQVRQVAKYLGLPNEIVYRQPFPGPGLLIRCVGKFTLEKLNVVRKATKIVEEFLKDKGFSQWFAASWEDEKIIDQELTKLIRDKYNKNVEVYKFTSVKGTGVKGNSRVYGPIILVNGDLEEDDVYRVYIDITTEDFDYAHVIYHILDGNKNGKYYVTIRAVITSNFMTAYVAKLSISELTNLAQKIINEIPEVSGVGYDISPKPPATIEFE